MASSKLTASVLEKEIKAIFAAPSFDFESESEKSIRKQVMDRLGMDGKFPSDKKELFKKVLKAQVQQQEEEESDDEDKKEDENHESDEDAEPEQSEGDDNDDDDNSLQDSDDDENVDPAPKPRKKVTKKKISPPKKKKQVVKHTIKKTKTVAQKAKPTKKTAAEPSASASYGPKVQSLLKLGQAMRMGPRLHAGLKEMEDDEERIQALTQRLQDAGAKWAGDIPTSSEIAAAKAKKQKQDDLDGLDTSLIIEGGRRRRGAAVNYALPNPLEESEEEEEEEAEEEEKETKKPAKKRKSPKSTVEEEDDSEDGDFQGDSSAGEDGSDESGSDAEFED